MFLDRGISVDAWVQVNSACVISCEIVGGQAQFEFGHRTGSMHLIVEPGGLPVLERVVAQAIADYEREDDE